MSTLFFDIIYSPDDGGFYGQVYDRQGKDIDETSILPTIQAVKQATKKAYPDAMLIKVIDN